MTYEERLRELKLFSLKRSRLAVGTEIVFKCVISGCKQEEYDQFPMSSGDATGNGETGLPQRIKN